MPKRTRSPDPPAAFKAKPLRTIEQRLERSRVAAEQRSLKRLEQQTRASFSSAAERRRDTANRAEHDRKQAALQEKARRIETQRREADKRRLARRKGELKRAYDQVADRRRDQARRAEIIRQQQDIQRRAAQQIEREQKQRADEHRSSQQHQMTNTRSRQKNERDSFRTNEISRFEDHHGTVKAIDSREERELAEFDGRRKGLAGRAAELMPGRRAENDRKRAAMVRGYESERMREHRKLEAYKERMFEREQRTRLAHANELRDLRTLHRDERETLGRSMLELRPGQIEDRARQLDRAEQTRPSQEPRPEPPPRTGDPKRPMSFFVAAASGHAADQAPETREATPAGADWWRGPADTAAPSPEPKPAREADHQAWRSDLTRSFEMTR